MPWVRFLAAFDFKPLPKVMFAYKPNREYLVKQSCANEAVAKGKAVLIERPKKDKNADSNNTVD